MRQWRDNFRPFLDAAKLIKFTMSYRGVVIASPASRTCRKIFIVRHCRSRCSTDYGLLFPKDLTPDMRLMSQPEFSPLTIVTLFAIIALTNV
jgi:hypothetical protein